MARVSPLPQVTASEVREIALDVIRKVHGKVATAAELLELHEAQVGRLAKDGDLKLKHFETLGAETLAAFGKELLERYGALMTPQARLRTIRREQRRLDDELDQLLEYIAS